MVAKPQARPQARPQATQYKTLQTLQTKMPKAKHNLAVADTLHTSVDTSGGVATGDKGEGSREVEAGHASVDTSAVGVEG